MTFKSQFDSNCKDCKKMHKVGDLIDRNSNGNYCRDGKNCIAAQGQQTIIPMSPGSPAISSPAYDIDAEIANATKVTTAFIDLCIKMAPSALANTASVFNTALINGANKRR